MVDYPIFILLGRRGAAKTLTATYLAYQYHNVDHMKIIANYHIFGLKNYEYMPFSEIKAHLSELYDCILILDEGQVGSDAYNFFRADVIALTNFLIELRKRHITMIITTQFFKHLAKRMRDQADYLLQPRKQAEGFIQVDVFDKYQPVNESYILTFEYQGKEYYDKYNTDEIIQDEEEKPKEEVKKEVTKSTKTTKSKKITKGP